MVQEDGADLAEVVHDIVEVLEEGRPPRSFEEIEVELVGGDRKALRRIGKALRKAGAVPADGRPKVFQALGFELPAPPVASNDAARATLQTVLRAQYDEILRHDPGTRMGDDPDALHDHRVAIRRLRALLRAGRPLLDRRWADELRGALRQAGRALAEVRDLDVMLGDVQQMIRGLPEPERSGASDVVERLRARRDAEQARLAGELCEAWYVSLLNRVEQAVDAPRFDGAGSLEKVVRKEHRRARKLVDALPEEASDAELHGVRKAVKRGRYAAELADAAGISGMAKYVKRAKTVQDVLGDHQDAVVASAMLLEIDGSLHRPAAHMAVEALQAAYDERRRAARKAFPKAWKRLDKRAPTPL
jgi:CHAD domain-containing protein